MRKSSGLTRIADVLVISFYMKVFQANHVAVITGAGSGIGRAMVLKCAIQYQMKVFCIDVDKEGLSETTLQVIQQQSKDTTRSSSSRSR
jgi:NADP-dependent 3-hydroxy acid dehydrogenase YdfG